MPSLRHRPTMRLDAAPVPRVSFCFLCVVKTVLECAWGVLTAPVLHTAVVCVGKLMCALCWLVHVVEGTCAQAGAPRQRPGKKGEEGQLMRGGEGRGNRKMSGSPTWLGRACTSVCLPRVCTYSRTSPPTEVATAWWAVAEQRKGDAEKEGRVRLYEPPAPHCATLHPLPATVSMTATHTFAAAVAASVAAA